MEPIGTIAKDFPFLDEESLTAIKSILEEAKDYAHFARLLSDVASNPNSSQELVFPAFMHALCLELPDAIRRIGENHSNAPAIRPYLLSSEGEGLATIMEAVEEVVEAGTSDMIAFHLYMRILRASPQGSKEETYAQEKIEKLIKKNKNLQPHSVHYYGHMGRRNRYEGKPENALKLYKRALKIAREHDDPWYQSRMLHLIAEITGTFSSSPESYEETKEHLLEAKRICDALNDKDGQAMILGNVAVISIGRREIMEGIKAQVEALRIKESLGHNISVGAYNLSRLYGDIGQGKDALEWAKIAMERWGHQRGSAPYAHLAMANAFIQLGRLNEAREHIDSAREFAFEAGLEMALGEWYATNGLLERRMGDFESALHSFEQAFEINERTQRQSRLRRALLYLAETELMMFSPTRENRDNETSGPWMSRLKELVEELRIPGYQAEYMLLKAELRTMQGRSDEVEEIMEAVLDITDSPGLMPIHERTEKVRQEWILEGILPPNAARRTRRPE
ncbi:MAG: tetratricopeptide repeat protein [Promethearchaeota archaeon]